MSALQGRKIVLGVGGGIAAYKAAILARELLRRGAAIRIAMTPSATKFVAPITFTGLTGEPPFVDLWDARHRGEIHVELGAWCEAMVIAPATANTIAKIAHGLVDDVISATASCCERPIVLAPAMHHRMWSRPANQRNIATLRDDGVRLVGPAFGALASGDEGIGRMAEPEQIAQALESLFASSSDLAGARVVVSAGPTHEAIDPVRFVGNRSSGKMGYAIAARARARGASVVLVSGPVALSPPSGVDLVRVVSAREMQAAVVSRSREADVVIMAAAVADFRPAEVAEHKLKKLAGEEQRTLMLVRNPDILAGLGAARLERAAARPILIGFAVETEHLVESARKKLRDKHLDLVVANHASVAFEGDQNEAVLVSAHAEIETGRMSKDALADRILDEVRDLLGGS